MASTSLPSLGSGKPERWEAHNTPNVLSGISVTFESEPTPSLLFVGNSDSRPNGASTVLFLLRNIQYLPPNQILTGKMKAAAVVAFLITTMVMGGTVPDHQAEPRSPDPPTSPAELNPRFMLSPISNKCLADLYIRGPRLLLNKDARTSACRSLMDQTATVTSYTTTTIGSDATPSIVYDPAPTSAPDTPAAMPAPGEDEIDDGTSDSFTDEPQESVGDNAPQGITIGEPNPDILPPKEEPMVKPEPVAEKTPVLAVDPAPEKTPELIVDPTPVPPPAPILIAPSLDDQKSDIIEEPAMEEPIKEVKPIELAPVDPIPFLEPSPEPLEPKPLPIPIATGTSTQATGTTAPPVPVNNMVERRGFIEDLLAKFTNGGKLTDPKASAGPRTITPQPMPTLDLPCPKERVYSRACTRFGFKAETVSTSTDVVTVTVYL
ncbi:hypothetical protein MKZ38_009761 [Zalerion maritima]|uniref:Uncharacterized protein n=1 Tax=Zalerion maritima TaxID=339359 RepID=A0AAD5RYA2_9PEZI|nr:hypothetical protein MKZ38_009761 [Zalerion maritima]